MPKVIAITGASAGIGRATALRLARDGWGVAMCARRQDRLGETSKEVARLGGAPFPLIADVSIPEHMDDMVARTVDHFGGLDVMMCNAGFGIYGHIDEITPAQMERLMRVNYLGTYHAARAALPVFRRQQRGHFVIVSSIVGKRGVPFMGAYAATKFAQVGLAECLRAELAGTGIHVSVVLPISTDTEFFGVMTKESGHATRAGGPRQTADQVADTIAQAIAKPIPEVYPLRKARALTILNALAPGLCDRVVQRWRREPIA
jgi:NAD(P)-dependent dehydrogenase (short-subunit alcohol dehydrogenase family)